MAFRFLHAADLHLDTPFHGLGRADARVAERLRDASLNALDALVDAALEEEVELVVLAGDLYDGPERGLRAQMRLHNALARLDEAGVRSVIVHGNHDPIHQGWAAVRRWPERCRFLGAEAVETVRFTARDGTPVEVHGLSYGPNTMRGNLTTRFPRVGGDAFHIGLLHANVGQSKEHEAYSPCTLDDLFATGHQYWALGHIHRRQTLATDPCVVVYPGNLQARSFKSSDLEPKGAVVVDVVGRHATPRFVALDRVRFATVDVDVGGRADVAELVRAFAERGERLRLEHDRALVVHARLVGRGGLAEQAEREHVRREILDQLRLEFEDVEPFLFWSGLDSDALTDVDIEALRTADDLVAELIAVADRLESAPDELDAVLRRLDPGAADVDAPAASDLLRESLHEAITRLRSTA